MGGGGGGLNTGKNPATTRRCLIGHQGDKVIPLELTKLDSPKFYPTPSPLPQTGPLLWMYRGRSNWQYSRERYLQEMNNFFVSSSSKSCKLSNETRTVNNVACVAGGIVGAREIKFWWRSR